MNKLDQSLRARLLLLILAPLLIVSCLGTYWRFETARHTAEEVYDNNLVMLCLAVARDVAYSGGDTLSQTTSNLFQKTTGGQVFYHVYGPDGSFVTGYSSPPVPGQGAGSEINRPELFDAVHQGTAVRAVRLAERVEIDGIRGTSVVTVWQQLEPRQEFARVQAMQAIILTSVLVLTVAALVLFGVRLGLRPLDQLEDAIKRRSITDLRPIERKIPIEAQGIVQRLNSLFSSLTDAKSSQDRLISQAAHQLRNPVAALHALAQATLSAKTMQDSKQRAAELVDETRHMVRMTQQMLSLERIRGETLDLMAGDLNTLAKTSAERAGGIVLNAGVDFELLLADHEIHTEFDAAHLNEAIVNLVDNALQHGHPTLTKISIYTRSTPEHGIIGVQNDGVPVHENDLPLLFERFRQGTESSGAGLGLSIIHEIATQHGGAIHHRHDDFTNFEIVLPLRKGPQR